MPSSRISNILIQGVGDQITRWNYTVLLYRKMKIIKVSDIIIIIIITVI
jgi:hypothetical protein